MGPTALAGDHESARVHACGWHRGPAREPPRRTCTTGEKVFTQPHWHVDPRNHSRSHRQWEGDAPRGPHASPRRRRRSIWEREERRAGEVRRGEARMSWRRKNGAAEARKPPPPPPRPQCARLPPPQIPTPNPSLRLRPRLAASCCRDERATDVAGDPPEADAIGRPRVAPPGFTFS